MSAPPAAHPVNGPSRAAAGDGRRADGRRAHQALEVHEPRWPALLAVIAVALLYFALPGTLTLGPPWLLPSAVLALLLPTVVSHRLRRVNWNQGFGILLLVVMTIALAAGLVRLIIALPTKVEAPATLLRSAAALWAANVLVFATWYWRIDAGGPHARAASHPRDAGWHGAFLFPQQTMDTDGGGGRRAEHWRPQFVDYLFLAFNASTAFSPTDAPVLSRWAKLLMMLQSLVSLATIAVLAARAINIL